MSFAHPTYPSSAAFVARLKAELPLRKRAPFLLLRVDDIQRESVVALELLPAATVTKDDDIFTAPLPRDVVFRVMPQPGGQRSADNMRPIIPPTGARVYVLNRATGHIFRATIMQLVQQPLRTPSTGRMRLDDVADVTDELNPSVLSKFQAADHGIRKKDWHPLRIQKTMNRRPKMK
jgi:hypothetical protein